MDFPDSFVEKEGVYYPRDPSEPIALGDGTVAERYVESVLRCVDDVSSDSLELRDHIKDWSSRYHLSPERPNLLRCLDIAPSARVLEIGAECGALTRYLGEHTREVVAVEANPTRARVCRTRCRGLPDVRVLVGNIFDLRPQDTFDIVTLIGVLEYAGVYCQEKGNPFEKLLQLAAQFLRPGGRLVLAIENQFGIKYFSGCGEDHGEPPFSGVEGYTEISGVRTFGRHELIELIRNSGFVLSTLLLPFPDYKVPDSFINAAHAGADEARQFGLVDWCRGPFDDHERERAYLFDDHLTLREMARNGLLAEHSNSFMVIASKGPDTGEVPIRPIDWIAQRFRVMRHPNFQTRSRLARTNGKSVITRDKLHRSPARAAANGKLAHELKPQTFVDGAESMALAMVRALRKRKGTEAAFAPLLAQWLCFFREEDSVPGNPSLIRGDFIDCIPDNLVRAADSSWHFVGHEWIWKAPVALDWVFYRGLVAFWAHHGRAIGGREWRQQMRLDRFIMRCFELLNSPLGAAELEALKRQEAEFQSIVQNGKDADPSPTSRVDSPSKAPTDPPHEDR